MEGTERDENELRSQIIDQLEQSLATSREMMMNLKLDPKNPRKMDPATHEHGSGVEHGLARQTISRVGEAAQGARSRRTPSPEDHLVQRWVERRHRSKRERVEVEN